MLTSEKGTKQAGEINFDVSEYINERKMTQKAYEHKLQGCPDKNARLSFDLTAKVQ